MGHPARVHAAAIRADAEAQLAALPGWPQPVRCRSGTHIGGLTCRQGRRPPAEPATGENGEVELVALPLEVWAAQHPR